MGYKLLGFAVWRGARWYLGRRFAGARTKLVAGGAIAAALVVVGLGARRASV